MSGDARRALDICRRATELSEEDRLKNKGKRSSRPQVILRHIAAAVQEMFSSPMIMAVRLVGMPLVIMRLITYLLAVYK